MPKRSKDHITSIAEDVKLKKYIGLLQLVFMTLATSAVMPFTCKELGMFSCVSKAFIAVMSDTLNHLWFLRLFQLVLENDVEGGREYSFMCNYKAILRNSVFCRPSRVIVSLGHTSFRCGYTPFTFRTASGRNFHVTDIEMTEFHYYNDLHFQGNYYNYELSEIEVFKKRKHLIAMCNDSLFLVELANYSNVNRSVIGCTHATHVMQPSPLSLSVMQDRVTFVRHRCIMFFNHVKNVMMIVDNLAVLWMDVDSLVWSPYCRQIFPNLVSIRNPVFLQNENNITVVWKDYVVCYACSPGSNLHDTDIDHLEKHVFVFNMDSGVWTRVPITGSVPLCSFRIHMFAKFDDNSFVLITDMSFIHRTVYLLKLFRSSDGSVNGTFTSVYVDAKYMHLFQRFNGFCAEQNHFALFADMGCESPHHKLFNLIRMSIVDA